MNPKLDQQVKNASLYSAVMHGDRVLEFEHPERLAWCFWPNSVKDGSIIGLFYVRLGSFAQLTAVGALFEENRIKPEWKDALESVVKDSIGFRTGGSCADAWNPIVQQSNPSELYNYFIRTTVCFGELESSERHEQIEYAWAVNDVNAIDALEITANYPIPLYFMAPMSECDFKIEYSPKTVPPPRIADERVTALYAARENPASLLYGFPVHIVDSIVGHIPPYWLCFTDPLDVSRAKKLTP